MAGLKAVTREKTALAEHMKNRYLANNATLLNEDLDRHLNPNKVIYDEDSIEHCKFLLAGGTNFNEFSKIGGILNCGCTVVFIVVLLNIGYFTYIFFFLF